MPIPRPSARRFLPREPPVRSVPAPGSAFGGLAAASPGATGLPAPGADGGTGGGPGALDAVDAHSARTSNQNHIPRPAARPRRPRARRSNATTRRPSSYRTRPKHRIEATLITALVSGCRSSYDQLPHWRSRWHREPKCRVPPSADSVKPARRQLVAGGWWGADEQRPRVSWGRGSAVQSLQ